MVKTIDLDRDLAGLVKLEGRGPHGVKVVTATPQPTEHLHVEDPRTLTGNG